MVIGQLMSCCLVRSLASSQTWLENSNDSTITNSTIVSSSGWISMVQSIWHLVSLSAKVTNSFVMCSKRRFLCFITRRTRGRMENCPHARRFQRKILTVVWSCFASQAWNCSTSRFTSLNLSLTARLLSWIWIGSMRIFWLNWSLRALQRRRPRMSAPKIDFKMRSPRREVQLSTALSSRSWRPIKTPLFHTWISSWGQHKSFHYLKLSRIRSNFV